jgi:hypothetical protein
LFPGLFALLAILENYQNADGSVTIPERLVKWVGKDRIGPPAGKIPGERGFGGAP